jgi:hypothetical protein
MQHVRPVPKIPEKKPISLRVGELLVKEGFIERHQLVQALDSQERGSQDAELPLGTLMVKKDLISEPDLERLLNHPDLRKNLGALLVEKNIITQKELETCLRLKKTNEPLGQVLIRRGLLTQHQLDTALEQQAGRVRIGELAYNLDMISEIDLDEVVRIKSGHRTIGEILCDLKMVTIEDLNYILRKYGKQLRLGDILLKQGLIDENQYQIAMQEQNQTRTKLGKVLVQRKYITPDQLYSALSRQFNIPYRAMGGYEFDSRQLKSAHRPHRGEIRTEAQYSSHIASRQQAAGGHRRPGKQAILGQSRPPLPRLENRAGTDQPAKVRRVVPGALPIVGGRPGQPGR